MYITKSNNANSLHSSSYNNIPILELNIGDYQIQKTIGEGAFSKVKLAIHKQTKQYVAIKILDKTKLPVSDLQRLTREMQILVSLNHLNVIQVNEILENKCYYYIVMEYCAEGDLFNYIIHKKRLSKEETSFIFYQIINGLEYIHSKNISHRDLKPENILMLSNRIVKIIDFGLSNYYNVNNKLTTPCGSPCYAAPEMILGKGYKGSCVDIWSTGIIVYAMICGYLPFEDKNNQRLFRKILSEKQKYPNYVSVNTKDILNKMLCKEPKDRITIQDIKKHPLYLEGKNIFNIKFNPAYDFLDSYNGNNIDNYYGSYFQTTVSTEPNQDKITKTKNNYVTMNNSRNNNSNNNCGAIKINDCLLEEMQHKQKHNKHKIFTRNPEFITDINNSNSLVCSDCNSINVPIENNIYKKKVHFNTNNNNNSVSINTEIALDSANNSIFINNNNNTISFNNKTDFKHLQNNNNNNKSSDNTFIDKEKKKKLDKPQITTLTKPKPITKLTSYNGNTNTLASINQYNKNNSHLIKVNKCLILNSTNKNHIRTPTLTTPLLSEANKFGFTPIKTKTNCNMNLTTYNKFKTRISYSNRVSHSLDKVRKEFTLLNPFKNGTNIFNSKTTKCSKNIEYKSWQTTNNSVSKQKRKNIYNKEQQPQLITHDNIATKKQEKRTVNKVRKTSKEKEIGLKFTKIDCLLTNNKNRSKSKSAPKNNITLTNKFKGKYNNNIDSDTLSNNNNKHKLNMYHPLNTITVNSMSKGLIKTNMKTHSNVNNHLNQKDICVHHKNNTLNDMSNISNKIHNKMLNNDHKHPKNKKPTTNKQDNTFSNKCIKNKQ